MRHLALLLLLLFIFGHKTGAQTIDINVEIEDEFLKIPLRNVKVSLLNPDSTVVVDSAMSISVSIRNPPYFI